MADSLDVIAQGYAPTSTSAVYTVPTGQNVIVKSLRLANVAAASSQVSLGINGTADDDLLFKNVVMNGGDYGVDDTISVGPGDTITVGASLASGVTYTIMGLATDAPSGSTSVFETKTATQTANVSYPGTWADITGCSMSLDPGVWLVWSNFDSSRVWFNTGGGASPGFMSVAHGIFRGSDNFEYQRVNFQQRVESEDRVVCNMPVFTIIDLSATTTVKLRGYMTIGFGTDFASGFRYDSPALEQPTVMYARRLA